MDSVLEHLQNPERAMSECHRVMRDGGLLFISFPLFYSPYGGQSVDYITEPWFHILPSYLVQKAIGIFQSKSGFITTDYVEKMYMSLNRMTLMRFKKLILSCYFKEIFFGEAFFMPHDVMLFIDHLKDGIRSGSLQLMKNAFRFFHFSSILIYIFLFILYRLPFRSARPFDEFVVSGVRSVLRK
jgi:SAM-dependent methyltransferase